MKYSELAAAFSKNDTTTINRLLGKLRPRLIRFLLIHLNASPEDAEDCAQDAFLVSLETIEKGQMRDAEQLLSFLLSACRNNYLNLKNKKSPKLVEENLDEKSAPPKQLLALLDKEKHDLLAQCLETLSAGYRAFIDYWFVNPDSEAQIAANHFDMSVANVWTKKHRIIKKLNACYQKKIKK